MINKKRYNELKEKIERKEFDDITKPVDILIIKTTDLKKRIIDEYLDSEYNYQKKKIDKFITRIFNEGEILGQEKIKQERIKLEVYEACINVGYIYENNTQEEKEKIVNSFIENIKNPNYIIRNVPKPLRKSSNFINYCLENKNISILSYITYSSIYAHKALKIVKEGYGTTLSNSTNIEYKKMLIKPLLENGYLDNFNIILRNQKQSLLPILINQIKNGNVYTIDNNAKNLFDYDEANNLDTDDEELFNLLIEKNQLEFINIIPSSILEPKIDKIINKIKLGYRIKNPNLKIKNKNYLKHY